METRRKDKAEGQSGTPVWMVTFSDLIMLMLTFFVMLLSMSSLDTKKLKDMFVFLGGRPGVLDFSTFAAVTDLAKFIQAYNDQDNMFVIDQSLLQELFTPSIELEKMMEEKKKEIDELIEIADDDRGIVMSFQENLLFDSGKVTIRKEALPVLQTIAKAINSCANPILIMGHSDDIPIRKGTYASNWELSSYRGLAVLEYFLKDMGLSPYRFSVGGYGPSRPRYPNDTPENRALNRRVEIIFRHL